MKSDAIALACTVSTVTLLPWASYHEKEPNSNVILKVETTRKSPKIVDNNVDRFNFLMFVKRTVLGLRISYGLWTYLLHSYLVYSNSIRLLHCPSPLDADYFQVSWLSTLMHLSCPHRPRTFVDLVSLIQFIFYASTLTCHFLDWKALERSLYLHGSYIMGGAIFFNFKVVRTLLTDSFWNKKVPTDKNGTGCMGLEWFLQHSVVRYGVKAECSMDTFNSMGSLCLCKASLLWTRSLGI